MKLQAIWIFSLFIDHVKSSPKWNPGKMNGEYVNVRHFVPVTFFIQYKPS